MGTRFIALGKALCRNRHATLNALAYLAVKSTQQRSFVMLGILLLLLQRPYVMSYGYSLLIVLTIFVLVNKHASEDMRELPMMPKTPDVLPAA